MTNKKLLKMAIEIVDLPSYKMVIFHSYVSLPEGTPGKRIQIASSPGLYSISDLCSCVMEIPLTG